MLYGSGWTQRWRDAPGTEEPVRSQLFQVGTATTGRFVVLDPGSDTEATLVVAWALVASAVLLEEATGTGGAESSGQHA